MTRHLLATLRTRVLVPAVLGASLLLSACGGANQRGAASGGVNAVATTSADDLALYMDFAAMREDKVLSSVMTKAEANADGGVAELIKRLDQVDASVTMANGAPSGVAVLWGRLGKDPKSVPLFASGAAGNYEAKPALASGVVEYETGTGGKSESLFVVSDAVWIVATGAFREQVRDRYAKSAEAPTRPRVGSVMHASAGSPFLAGSGASKQLASLDHLEVDVKSGAASLQGELAFKDEAGAKEAESKMVGLVALLQLVAKGASGKCTAADQLRLHVERKATTVSVALEGIDKAAAAWDPALCSSSAGAGAGAGTGGAPLPVADEAAAASPPPPPPPEPPPAKPTKKPRPHRKPVPKRAPSGGGKKK